MRRAKSDVRSALLVEANGYVPQTYAKTVTVTGGQAIKDANVTLTPPVGFLSKGFIRSFGIPLPQALLGSMSRLRSRPGITRANFSRLNAITNPIGHRSDKRFIAEKVLVVIVP